MKLTLTPAGMFFCKGCKQLKPLGQRNGHYGKCKECSHA